MAQVHRLVSMDKEERGFPRTIKKTFKFCEDSVIMGLWRNLVFNEMGKL